jgi:methionyl-tRNA formyltransferase
MRIVFMGTPDFAVNSLTKLKASSHDLVGVVTQPDRPKGRGRQMASSPVKQAAEGMDVPIYQPQNLKDSEFLSWLTERQADCFVVVGFRILPPEVYEMPPKGTINLHASLLPKYRGAAPIQWALIHGEKETGVTTFFIERKVDTGDIILQDRLSIGDRETAGELHDRLALIGADLLLRTVDLIHEGHVECISQRGTPSSAPKILPEHCLIDWSQSADRIVNLVRGLSPRPGAFTIWMDQRIKIFDTSVLEDSLGRKGIPGRINRVTQNEIQVEAGTGIVCIRELQIEGKRKMKTPDFLRGRDLDTDTLFGE